MTSPRTMPEAAAPAPGGGATRTPSHHSAMVRRFGLLPRWFARLAFQHVRLDAADIERLRRLASDGTLVYVMRYRSLVDYFLINWILLHEGLPLPRFANGISSLWLRPLRDLLAILWRRVTSAHLFGKEVRQSRERDLAGQLVAHGRSVLLFIRSSRVGMVRARGSAATPEMRRGSDYLREIAHDVWSKESPVFLVPLAIFRGSGLRRKGSRLASFVYSVHEAPSDLKKLLTYVWNAHELTVSVGSEIPLNAFVAKYQGESEDRIVRRLTRALQMFLYREERVVWGPTVQSKRQVREMVLGSDAVQAAVRDVARERKVAAEKVAKEARGYFDEMAADFHGYYLAILAFFFHRIWRRMFSGLEIRGLERVVECVKQHPIVLVPCHRSHFDYLILSYIFRENYLSPPHIAAGINMAFWPMAGALPRRRRLLHPPAVRRQPALQGRVPDLSRVSHPRGLHAGVLHRGRTEPDREDPDAEARHAVRDRQRLHRTACAAISTSFRYRSTTAASSRRRHTSRNCSAGRRRRNRSAR